MRTIHDSRYRCVINRLVAVRRERGLTQVQVARRLGWQRTKLSNVETRQRRLDVLELHNLCRIYGLRLADMDELLDGGGGDARSSACIKQDATDNGYVM